MKIKKTCLVTGGAGFIGSHLCTSLVDKGYIVYSVDNLLTGNINNIRDLIKDQNFKFLKKDVSEFNGSELKDLDIDYIFHLASPASPPQYRRYSIETLTVNSVGTHNMLEIAKNKKSRFLLASTSEVYGDPKEHPQKESYYGNVNPVGLRACYDESKRFAEAITMEYFRKYKVDVRIVRIFNTYGPNMQVDDGRVISNFINQAIRNKPLTIYGQGLQTRSFCFVSDMVRGIIRAMEKSGIAGEIINLGNPNEMNIIQIAELILKITNSESKIDKLDIRLENDPERRKPDINKARKLIEFIPDVNIETGLKKTVSYFKSL